MKLLFSFMTLLLFCHSISRQVDSRYLVAYVDTAQDHELIGFKYRNGKKVIQAKFNQVYSDTMYNMAIILKDGEWVGIDRAEDVILKPFIFDNGPDYEEEGLFRFVEDGKMGFADSNGRKIIKASYDFAEPFRNGLAAYTLGGHKEYNKSGEHWWWTGGYESGFVNKKGQEFIRVTDLKNNKREVWTKDKKHYLLDKEGYIIKTMRSDKSF